MAQDKPINRIPLSIKADSAQELSLKCHKNNLLNDKPFDYFDFQKDGTSWICFFYADIQTLINYEMINFKKVVSNG